jgi:ATP-dependent RNA helicase DeaD
LMPSFQDFSLQPATRAVLAKMDIIEPTPIQAQAIPVLLAGKDLVGQSATGSGKTLAYSIPLVERLSRDKRAVQALVLVPTRELAMQVNTVLSQFATARRLTTALLVGGKPYGNQISALRYGAQIVVGTPGRIKDHLDRGSLTLNQVRICILDEADQMLDIGFAPVIEEILSTTPDNRQMALFSATIPEWVAKLQQKFLKDAVKIDISVEEGGESTIEQIAYQVLPDQKIAALCTLLHEADGESSIIFGKTKYGVEKLGKQLSAFGFTVATLHGNKSQNARDKVLTAFRRGHVHTLLATNVAARGLDIQDIHQVINYELPESSDLFTHRIGRTGRMGKQGKAITLLVPSDVPKWRRMARTLGQTVTLHKLAINQEAMTSRPAVILEDEHEQYREQPPIRRQYRDQPSMREQLPARAVRRTQDQEHNRFARPERDSYEAPGSKRRQSDYIPSERAEWQPETLPQSEDSYAISRERDDRRRAGRQSSSERAPQWQQENVPQFEESSYRERDNSRALGNEYTRTPRKQKTLALVTKEGQPTSKRKSGRPTPSIRARRAATSNRSTRH